MSVEQVRDYWNRRPCNIRHSTKTPGTREYFDDVEKENTLWSRISRVLRILSAGKGKRCLKLDAVLVRIQ